jgi:hypothetical protein
MFHTLPDSKPELAKEVGAGGPTVGCDIVLQLGPCAYVMFHICLDDSEEKTPKQRAGNVAIMTIT